MLIAILTGNPFFASCLLSSLLLAVWKIARKDAGILWPHVTFAPIWAGVSTLTLGISALALPLTLDYYLFKADGSYGFQAAFLGAQFLLAHRWLLHICEVCYFNLPLAVTALYLLLRMRSGDAAARRFLRFAVYLAVAGSALYLACPAVGPGGAFPRMFPFRVPHPPVAWVAIPFSARNCMPSMHTAWIVCLLICAPPMPRWMRAVQWAFSAFTLLYALSAGGHYLVDLVVAVPFTMAAWAAFRGYWRSPGFWLNAAMVALWFVLLRWDIGIFSLSPAVPYGLTALALISPWWSGLGTLPSKYADSLVECSPRGV